MKKLFQQVSLGALILSIGVLPAFPEMQVEGQNELPQRILTLDSLAHQKISEPQWWHVYAAPGAQYDTNINHLLINSSADSTTRVSDTSIMTNAGATLKPPVTSWFLPTFSYNFERYDYLQHSSFSFYGHHVFGSLHERISQSWSLEQGVGVDWYADDSGLVTDDYSPYAGLRWKHWGFHGRFGYAYRRDGYIYSPDKDSHSNMGYAELSRFFRWSFLFLGYYYRRNHAANEVFSYDSHFVEAGWTANWTPRWRTLFDLTYYNKGYDGYDLRFNQTRYDQTYSASVRPSYAIFPPLRLVGNYTYSVNHSTVEAKQYVDQIYGLSLEARF